MKQCKVCTVWKPVDCFYVGRRKCKDCVKRRVRDYRQKNSLAIRIRRRKQESTPEYKLGRSQYYKQYYQKNRKHLIAYTAEWRVNNPETARQTMRKALLGRRARLQNAPGFYTSTAWLEKVFYHGWRCFYCNCRLTNETLTCDHRIPLSRKGTNWLSNLVPACKSCNSSKGNALWPKI
jgi:5-methylcytosine-specific restriction endonuclease McrA